MARRDSSIRVSIVVPHLGDDAAFESTLVSVLENCPSDADVWVAHDGSYQDPFDLGDEVRFVSGDNANLPELVAAAAEVVPGRFVHVLAAGVCATENWLQGALEKFEHDDTALVSPVARCSANGAITAAGWTSTASRLVSPIALGAESLGRRDAAKIRGVCLAASFWRREQLQDVATAFPTRDTSAAQFTWSRLLTEQGWRCLLAEESTVIAEEAMLGLCPSLRQGHLLRSIESALKQQSLAAAALSVGVTAICNLHRPSHWGAVSGETFSLMHRSAMVRCLRPEAVGSPQAAVKTIRMPNRSEVATSYSRAA